MDISTVVTDVSETGKVIPLTYGWLEDNEFITIKENVLLPTKLGEATIAAGMHPNTALEEQSFTQNKI